jgi:hypothetical protein
MSAAGTRLDTVEAVAIRELIDKLGPDLAEVVTLTARWTHDIQCLAMSLNPRSLVPADEGSV